MKDENKTKKELIKELSSLRKRISKLEQLESGHRQAGEASSKSERHLPVELNYDLSTEEKETAEDFTIFDLVNIEDLQGIQDSFAKATGVASIITDLTGNLITRPSNFCKLCEIIRKTEKGSERCKMSDRIRGKKARKEMKPAYYKCLSCGLVDASAPIIVAGKHIANWLIGQTNAMGVDRQRIIEYAAEIGTDVDEMLRAYETMPQMTLERFKLILDLLWHFAREISTLGYNNLKMTRDITERKRMEEALRKSESMYRSTIENASGVPYQMRAGFHINSIW